MKKKNKNKKRISPSIRRFYPMLILVLCLFMSIGYAIINSNNLTIGGDVLALEQDGVFITEVQYKSDINASLTKTEIKATQGTILNSSITLSESDPSSSITYTITVYNNNLYDCTFSGNITYDPEFYDNQNIIVELADPNIKNTLISSKKYFTFDITFKYKEGVTPSSSINTLNSVLNLEFNSIAILQNTTSSDTKYFRSKTYKQKIKNINFENKINIPEDAIEAWDIGVDQNGDLMAYVVANDTDSSYYDLYIQANGKIRANQNMSHWFREFKYVDSINGLELLDTSLTTNMYYMFCMTGYSSTTFTLDVSNLDTSNVTNMGYMFSNTGRTSKTFELDGINFDTSNVTNMEHMFEATGYSNTTFTLDISNLDTSNVTNMRNMFEEAGYSSTTFTLDVSNFDTSNVTNMEYMFYRTGYKNKTFSLNVSNFDTSNVTTMSNMFYYTGYNSTIFTLDVSAFNTSEVLDMSSMFKGTGYNNATFTLDVSNFKTNKTTNMSGMFEKTGYMSTTLELDISNFDTSNVTNMSNMFFYTGYNNTNFDLDLSNFDTSKVTNMSSMFYQTGYKSTKFNIDFIISNPQTTSYSSMFNGVATKSGSQITVNYTNETSDLVDQMIATKSSTSNVVKGYNLDEKISFSIAGTTYSAYENMKWEQWLDSELNNDDYMGDNQKIYTSQGAPIIGCTPTETIIANKNYEVDSSIFESQ